VGASLSVTLDDERSLVLSAAAKLAAREGYEALTVPRIRAAAGVSRKAFDAHFDGVDSCFLDAVELLGTRAVEDAVEQGSAGESWAVQVHRSVAALCRAIARDPVLAKLAFIEILALGPVGLQRRERLIAAAAARLRDSAPAGSYTGNLVAEASVGAVWDAIHHQIVIGRAHLLPQKAPTLSFLLLAPAVGAPAATTTINDEQER
jgi:AcrR family transcriptional regulator